MYFFYIIQNIMAFSFVNLVSLQNVRGNAFYSGGEVDTDWNPYEKYRKYREKKDDTPRYQDI